MAMDLNATAALLNKSAAKYRQTLLMLPSIGIEEVTPYMTGFPGITYSQTIGQIFSDAGLRPYTGDNNATDTTDLKERTLYTQLGSMVENFDPNVLKQTVWATLQAASDKVRNGDFSKAQLMAIMNSVLAKLGAAVWSGVRNGAGETTADLFDGFDKITADEITATKISAGLKNMFQFTAAIDKTNAVDQLRDMYAAATPELKRKNCNVFVDPDILVAYQDDLLNTLGSVPYNNKYEQTVLHGTGGKWKLVPLVGKAGSNYVHVTQKSNLIYGYGNGVEKEKIEVRRGDNAFKLQFILAMFFGVQFASIDPKALMVGKAFAG